MSECEKKGGKGADKSAGQLKKQTLAQALSKWHIFEKCSRPKGLWIYFHLFAWHKIEGNLFD